MADSITSTAIASTAETTATHKSSFFDYKKERKDKDKRKIKKGKMDDDCKQPKQSLVELKVGLNTKVVKQEKDAKRERNRRGEILSPRQARSQSLDTGTSVKIVQEGKPAPVVIKVDRPLEWCADLIYGEKRDMDRRKLALRGWRLSDVYRGLALCLKAYVPKQKEVQSKIEQVLKLEGAEREELVRVLLEVFLESIRKEDTLEGLLVAEDLVGDGLRKHQVIVERLAVIPETGVMLRDKESSVYGLFIKSLESIYSMGQGGHGRDVFSFERVHEVLRDDVVLGLLSSGFGLFEIQTFVEECERTVTKNKNVGADWFREIFNKGIPFVFDGDASGRDIFEYLKAYFLSPYLIGIECKSFFEKFLEALARADQAPITWDDMARWIYANPDPILKKVLEEKVVSVLSLKALELLYFRCLVRARRQDAIQQVLKDNGHYDIKYGPPSQREQIVIEEAARIGWIDILDVDYLRITDEVREKTYFMAARRCIQSHDLAKALEFLAKSQRCRADCFKRLKDSSSEKASKQFNDETDRLRVSFMKECLQSNPSAYHCVQLMIKDVKNESLRYDAESFVLKHAFWHGRFDKVELWLREGVFWRMP